MIALGVAAIIILAAAYYEVPALLNRTSSASSSPTSSLDYPTEYGNTSNWAWSADTGLSAANASLLALKGYNSFPVQTTPFLAGGDSRQVALGGISYVANVGNYELYAMNIETQSEIYDVSLPNSPVTPLPFVLPFFHIGTTSALGSGPVVWVSTPWDGIYGFPSIQATKADYAFNVTAPQKGQDGNVGTYSWAAPNFAIDEQRQMVVAGLSVNTTGIPGRGFVEGLKLGNQNATLKFSGNSYLAKTATTAWGPLYLSPPQDGTDPGWELAQVNSIPHVWEFNGTSALDLRTLTAGALQAMLSNDWTAQSGRAVFSSGPESNSSWIADPSTDTTYIATSAPQSVSLNSSFNGPALFGSSIIALDTSNGSIRWTFQVTPHDVWGWGCKGNIAMVPATIGGAQEQVIAKQCENGYLFLLNPTTGHLLYSGQEPGVSRATGAQIPNVQNSQEMQTSLASLTGDGPTQVPTLAYGTNIAYDPVNHLLLGAVGRYASPLGAQTPASKWNSTAYGFNLANLALSWQAPVPNQDISYVGIADGVAYLATYQGEIYVVNALDGSQLKDIHADMTVTSLLVTNDVHGHPALAVSGYTIQTKQQTLSETFTPSGT